jgi:uncharacterized membrane protein YhaH (DUF805 family)
MDFMTAVKTCFAKYATFSGRASRSEYWWFFLFYFIVAMVLAMVSTTLYAIGVLAMVLPIIAVGARRLHDIGKSGWFLLLGLIPLVNLILLYWAVQPSGPQNEWGEPAVAADAAPAALPPGAT